MKKLILFLTMALFVVSSHSQVAVNTDESAPDNSAILDVKSTDRGFLPPRLSSTERDAISNPAEGLLIYNTDSLCLEWWIGSAWYDACSKTTYSPPMPVNGGCGEIWMDRNLGASQAASSSTDYLAYGFLFQWGRAAEGHEIINWTSSTSSDGAEQANEISDNATTALPNLGNTWDGKFILETSSPYDWLAIQDDNLWQGVSGINNPCPIGFRLPIYTELNCERLSWSSNNAAGAFASPLKLPVAAYRERSDGSLRDAGIYGLYWSSTVSGTSLQFLYFFSINASMSTATRASGFSVRCIKD